MHSILLLSLACLILIVAHRVRGHSSGAPEESCDSLTVRHTHVGQPVPGLPCGPYGKPSVTIFDSDTIAVQNVAIAVQNVA